MPCEIHENIIVCGPPRGVYKRTAMTCPECDDQHDAIVKWDGAWYGTTLYGSCGDTWQDGWRARRPFARYWRRDAQRRFRLMWEAAAPDELWDAYVQADCEMAACDDDNAWEGAAERRDSAHAAILAARDKDK